MTKFVKLARESSSGGALFVQLAEFRTIPCFPLKYTVPHRMVQKHVRSTYQGNSGELRETAEICLILAKFRVLGGLDAVRNYLSCREARGRIGPDVQ